MKFLLTNDDGIEAPGLAALIKVASAWGEVVVVAPDRPLSGCSHQATTHRPLKVTSQGQTRHAVDGAPADCVRLGLQYFCPDADWVLSGINDGANLGTDVHHSGTVAAAREAALAGFSAAAISQYRRPDATHQWSASIEMGQKALARALGEKPAPGVFWNINLPHLDDAASSNGDAWSIIECSLDPHPLPVMFEQDEDGYHYRGDYHNRERKKGRDVDVCFSGNIALTRIAAWG